MSTVLASGASERYGYWLLNMIGSVKANSDVFDRIVLFDLGLSPLQRRLVRAVRGVEVREVPAFVPHWREGRTWKTWIWTHVEAERLFWLDAGLTVLRPLDEALAQVDRHGYFAVSQGVPLARSVPAEYYELFGLRRELASRPQIAAGILGFDTRGAFYDQVVVPTYEAALQGFSVGFSECELSRTRTGLDRTDAPVVRDCDLFRHEQTLLGIHLYRAIEEPVVDDIHRFAGWLSPRDHPEQVIWSHRRRGDFAYMPRVPYRARVAPLGLVFGWWLRLDWWRTNHSWLFRPTAYVGKLRRVARRAS